MTLYIWFLLTIPRDRLVCSLWINQLTQSALTQACGSADLSRYRLDVYNDVGPFCTIPAAALMQVIEQCHLSGRLDAYRMNIVESNYQTAICSVTTPTNTQPDRDAIKRQCPEAKEYIVKFAGTRDIEPEADSICKPPAVDQPSQIATSENYYLLAGKLIWYGYAKGNCPGGLAGVDPSTFAATPCGMDGARARMLDWQNGLDAEIIAAASMWHVPAALLKETIAKETQFWTWTGVDDEHGLIQITEDGAAVVLHVYHDGYYRLSEKGKREVRQAWLRQLDCLYCTPLEAYNHAREAMPLYAQALAAYYCMYGSWDAALRAWNVNQKVLQ